MAADPDQATPEQRWIQGLNQRMVYGKVLVAIANKHARKIWAILANEVDYDPCADVSPVVQPKVTSA